MCTRAYTRSYTRTLICRNIAALLSVPFKHAGYTKSFMLDGAGRSKMPSFIQSRVYLDVEHLQGGVKQGWITFALVNRLPPTPPHYFLIVAAGR